MARQTAGDDDPLRALAEAARRGDRGALADLLRGLQDTLFRFCLARLGAVDQAHDATQETAMRLIRAIENYRGASRVRTWALGVAVNVCREESRRRGRAPAENPSLDASPSRDAGPAARAATRESTRAVRLALGALPARQAEAVTLRYLEQLTVKETAAAMRCSEGAVKAAVWQGLRTLRQRLGGRREPTP